MKPCLSWVLATIVFILFLISILTPTFYKTIKGKFQSVKPCTNETFSKLIHLPLLVTLHDNVNITSFERSGCFVLDTGKSGLSRIIHERNFAHITCNATRKKFLSNSQNNKNTALASIPGSGNTWTRHLLEEVTGIYTGSIYNDPALKKFFPGERMERNVIAVKTHLTKDIPSFNRAILVVRDPFESALATYNYGKAASHVRRMKKQHFDKKVFISQHVYKQLRSPEKGFNVKWIKEFKGDILVLFYEKLRTDLLNSLTKMAAFTNSEVTLAKLWCIFQNKAGHFYREPRPDWMSRESLINETIEEDIRVWKRAVQKAIDSRVREIATN